MKQSNIDYSPLKELNINKSDNILVMAIILIVSVFGIIVVGAFAQLNLSVLAIIGFLAVVGLAIYQSYQQAKKNKQILINFAQANNWQYTDHALAVNGPGTVFSIGHSKVARYIISGSSHELPFSTYAFSYTVGSGKNQRSYDLQVFELTLPRKLPHMVIDSLVESGNGSSSTLPIEFAESQKIELEGDFSKYFSLYAPDNYGITALTVLAPDAMEILMKYAAKCDIEIIENKLFFYWPDTATSQKAYEDIFNSVEQILAKTLDKLTTSDIYATDKQSSLHATATATGARLKVGWWNKTTKSLLIVMFTVAMVMSSAVFSEDTAAGINAILFLLFAIGMFVALVAAGIRAITRGKKRRDLEKRIV